MRLGMWYVGECGSLDKADNCSDSSANLEDQMDLYVLRLPLFTKLRVQQGEEVLYLPTIVESCESSPSAAKEAAYVIRKFLSKDNFSKPYVQYNGIMLIRILADNPGKTFTRNVDTKFVETVKELLRVGRDPSVKQILMETLDTFQRDKADDEGLFKLNEMWKKEHERMIKIHVCGSCNNYQALLTFPGTCRTSSSECSCFQSQ